MDEPRTGSFHFPGLGWRHYQSYPPPAASTSWRLGAAFELAPEHEAGEDLEDLQHSYFGAESILPSPRSLNMRGVAAEVTCTTQPGRRPQREGLPSTP